MDQSHFDINQDPVTTAPPEVVYAPFVRFERDIKSEDYTYYNVASCPDCSGGMIRQGRCCVCPSCGYESCLI